MMMTRFYVDKSTLVWDLGYFGDIRGHDPRTDPRQGLFQEHHGKFNLDVIGPDIVSMDRTQLHPSQVRYVMESGYDEDFVIVPTLLSIQSGEIPLPFRVNHDSHNPTHRLVWVPDGDDYPHSHYMFEGLREIKIGTEITFDYKFKKKPTVYKF
jgi:hypothetical protein